MRVLATLSFSFSAAIFAAVLLPDGIWWLYGAAAFALCGIVLLFLRRWKHRKRGLIIAFSLCAGLAFFGGYRAWIAAPVEARCGQEGAFSAVVCEMPVKTTYGAEVTVRLPEYHNVRAVYYSDPSLLTLEPGNRLSGTAYWKRAEYSTDISREIFVYLYDREDLTTDRGTAGSMRWWPQRVCGAFREKTAQLWEDPSVNAFVSAELLGDKSGMVQEDYTALKETGLAHLFAVSGLHCAFLVSLTQLCIPAHRRRIGAGVTIAVLLFFMCMTGLTPSVVRAGIMQIFLLTAPLFLRAGDPLTSLGTALMVILLANPYAAAGVSLQLSFAATFGMATITPRIFHWLKGLYIGRNKMVKKAIRFIGANLAASLGAMVFTVPLTACYFHILSLVSPLTGVLTIWAAGWSFMSGFIAVLAGFVWLPLGKLVGVATALLVRYILGVAHLLTRLPYHAVYFQSDILRYWLVYTYALFGICAVFRREKPRKYAVAAGLSALMLVLTLRCNTAFYRRGTLGVTALNVGQGQSVLLYSGREAAVVDCGSSTEYLRAGDIAAAALADMGYTRLEAVVVTHYHADHTNGLQALLDRIPVDILYLPDIEDEYGVRQTLCELADAYGSEIIWVREKTEVPLSDAVLTLFPPMDGDDLNEQCVALLGSAGDFDVLITGDMPAAMETALAETCELPDTEVLVVGHHGSKNSSCREFLDAIKPDTALISVGKNSYGHPAQETLWRLSNAGAEIYRTDEAGHITVQSNGGEG